MEVVKGSSGGVNLKTFFLYTLEIIEQSNNGKGTCRSQLNFFPGNELNQYKFML